MANEAADEVWERFGRLPLAEDERGKIYARIRKMPLSELGSLIPSFLDDTAVAAALREEFLSKKEDRPEMSPMRKRYRNQEMSAMRKCYRNQEMSAMRKCYVEHLKRVKPKHFEIVLGKGYYADWLLGPDVDVQNCGLPEERWEQAAATKEILRKVGYSPGKPLETPNYCISWLEPCEGSQHLPDTAD